MKTSKRTFEFIKAFSNWKQSFILKELNSIKSPDVKNIIEKQKNKEIEYLLNFWDEATKKKHFELNHPELDSITTRAIYNVRHGMCNFVFFIDQNDENLWVLVQCQYIIDTIVTSANIYGDISNNGPIGSQLHKLQHTNIDALKFKNIEHGFIVTQGTPYHFYYDILKNIVYLSEKNRDLRATYLSPFFKIKKLPMSSEEQNFVGLLPVTVGNNHLNQSNDLKTRKLNERMERIVLEDCIDSTDSNVEKNTLKIWYGITGQKRCWKNQIDACVQIIENLNRHFPLIDLYIDGMTAPEGMKIDNAEDNAIFKKINEKLGKSCNVISLIGRDYRSKIVIANSIDFFIANSGTGCMVPLRFCKKPGIVHGNTKLFAFPDDYPQNVKFVSKKYIIDDRSDKPSDHISYSIPWQHVYNLVIEILFQEKAIRLPNINFSFMEGTGVTNFSFFEFSYDTSNKSPKEILNHVARSFEEIGDYETAYKIVKQMELIDKK